MKNQTIGIERFFLRSMIKLFQALQEKISALTSTRVASNEMDKR